MMGATGCAAEPLTPPPLAAIEAVTGAWAAYAAAWGAGILDRLAVSPVHPEGLAEELGLDPRLTDALLRVLAALEVARRDGAGRYRVEAAVPELARHAEAMFSALPGSLRIRDAAGVERPEISAAVYPAVVGFLAGAVRGVAAELAAVLAAPGLRVLDLGAGAAPWSVAIVQKDPSCQVVAVDLPEVLPVTREAVAAAGVLDQFSFLAADMMTLPLAPVHDLVLLANVCHLFDAVTAGELLSRAAGALRLGGMVAVIDVVPDDGAALDRTTAIYALGLKLRSASGEAHDATAYRRWYAAAGLDSFTLTRTATGHGLALVRGRKPAL